MAEMPKVKLSDKLWVGLEEPGSTQVKAVVCNVSQGLRNSGADIQVVFFDHGKAIKKSARWAEDHWEFAESMGSYADRDQDLQEFIQILRHER